MSVSQVRKGTKVSASFFREKGLGWKELILVIGLISMIGLISCAAGLQTPPLGVTRRLVRETDGQLVRLEEYDFSRLKRGYGLCVFGYDLTGTRGNRIIGSSPQEKKGIRVWEYGFEPDDWERTFLDKKFLVWAYRGFSTLFLVKSGYSIRTIMEFRKGRVVYAGRIVYNTNNYYNEPPSLEMHVDEDLQPLLDLYGKELTDIKIDIVPMQVGY